MARLLLYMLQMAEASKTSVCREGLNSDENRAA